jgi:hypothetical protein
MSDVPGVTEVNGIKEYRYFVYGGWHTAESNKLFDVGLTTAACMHASP